MTNQATTQTDGGIRIEGLTKSFRGPQGPVRAVRGIDVSIAAGETAALLGPNGAGKSTTIDMIAPPARRSTRDWSARCCRAAR
jgi:ABC-2 type transport system ATP-binding protein